MKKSRCIDAGRQGCPCALAECGQCLICAKLRGGTCQECSWQGTCIYSLYEQNGRSVILSRKDRLLKIKQVKTYSDDLKVFIVEADRGFCQKAQTAGAYVFVRAEDEAKWYDAPISVLKAEPEAGLLHLGICRCGPKSSSIFQAEKNLWIRGVYYNALSGFGALRENAQEAFVYAKGIAIAPLRNFLDGGERYSRWLGQLHVYVDLEKVGFDFFRDYFGDLPAEAVEVRDFAKEGLCSLDDLDHMEGSDSLNVFALTSPYYASQVERAAGSSIVRPVEGNMCCGEGICGACTCTDEMGRTVRRCKIKE